MNIFVCTDFANYGWSRKITWIDLVKAYIRAGRFIIARCTVAPQGVHQTGVTKSKSLWCS